MKFMHLLVEVMWRISNHRGRKRDVRNLARLLVGTYVTALVVMVHFAPLNNATTPWNAGNTPVATIHNTHVFCHLIAMPPFSVIQRRPRFYGYGYKLQRVQIKAEFRFQHNPPVCVFFFLTTENLMMTSKYRYNDNCILMWCNLSLSAEYRYSTIFQQ